MTYHCLQLITPIWIVMGAVRSNSFVTGISIGSTSSTRNRLCDAFGTSYALSRASTRPFWTMLTMKSALTMLRSKIPNGSEVRLFHRSRTTVTTKRAFTSSSSFEHVWIVVSIRALFVQGIFNVSGAVSYAKKFLMNNSYKKHLYIKWFLQIWFLRHKSCPFLCFFPMEDAKLAF